MCEHDWKKNKATLILLPNRRMVSPQKFSMQCTECGEVFTVSEEDISSLKDFVVKYCKN